MGSGNSKSKQTGYATGQFVRNVKNNEEDLPECCIRLSQSASTRIH